MKRHYYFIPGWGFSANVWPEHLVKHPVRYLDDESVDKMSLDLVFPISIIAWSFGGLLAILLAEKYPYLVEKLILISSQPKMLEDDGWAGITKTNADRFSKKLHESEDVVKTMFLSLIAFPDRNLEMRNRLSTCMKKLTSSGMLNSFNELLKSDYRNQYANLECKILHIINERDAIFTQDPTRIKKLNSNAHFEIINSGHAGFLTHQKIYREIINDFL